MEVTKRSREENVLFSPDEDLAWNAFKTKFNKSYKTGIIEGEHKKWYLDRRAEIVQHNKEFNEGLVDFEMDLNDISDYTMDEVNKLNGIVFNETNFQLLMSNEEEDFDFFKEIKVPDSIDWVAKGYVARVRYQSACGSCHIFAALAVIEAAVKRKTGKLYSLSPQHVMDCSKGNQCNGGWMIATYEFVKKNKINLDSDYPYIMKDTNKCKVKKTKTVGSVSKIINLKAYDENNLKKIVGTIGPVAVGIYASAPSLVNYKGGVYSDKACMKQINHGVVIVGYGGGTKGVPPFWKVKNSWGDTWGEKGYFRIKRGSNMCQIAKAPNYVIA
uniref:Pept_C1 domain-containing protein n=1 Tax=Rhabditophanes sp. KR3021 TaxID=114890 RepID=A0AC35U2U6_9BILA